MLVWINWSSASAISEQCEQCEFVSYKAALVKLHRTRMRDLHLELINLQNAQNTRFFNDIMGL